MEEKYCAELWERDWGGTRQAAKGKNQHPSSLQHPLPQQGVRSIPSCCSSCRAARTRAQPPHTMLWVKRCHECPPRGWRGRGRVTVPLSTLETARSCPFQHCSAGQGWKMRLETKQHTLVPQHTVLIKSRTKHYPSLIIIIIPGRSNCWGYFKLQSTRYFEN